MGSPPAPVSPSPRAGRGGGVAGAAVSAPPPAPPRTSRRRTVRPSRAGSEASLPRLVLAQASLQPLQVEVGPELLAEDQLRVGALPEQVVGDPLLAAGPYQEVGIVHLGRVEVVAELLLGVSLEASRRVDDLRPAAVVEGDEESDPLVAG